MEAKYDVQRGLAVVSDGVVTVCSRNGANITSLGVIQSRSRPSFK